MKKTHGQKRKGRVFAVAAVIFCALTAGGVYLYQSLMGSAYDWIDRHQEVQGVVISKSSEVDEYRNLKGRKRTTTYYYLEIEFEIDGDPVVYYAEPGAAEYKATNEGDARTIWYDPEDPYYNHALKEEVANGKQTAIASALPTVVPISGGISWFLYSVLMFLFGRESRKKLAEGFYTENSWLDVEDDKLVLINKDLLLVAKFDKSARKSITKAYQEGASQKELLVMFKDDQIKSVTTASTTSISSRHDQDTIQVTAGDKDINLDFLNIGTKAHALEQIQNLMGQRFEATVTKRSRLRSIAPRLVTTLLLVGAGYFMSNFLVWLVVGFLLLSVVPSMLRRVVDPTVLTELKVVEDLSSIASGESIEPEALPKAA